MRSVLLVANRQKIKEGTYDVDQDLARKWRSLGADGQYDYYRRFTEGDYGEEAGKKDIKRLAEADDSEGEGGGRGQGQDVEMGEESGEGDRD